MPQDIREYQFQDINDRRVPVQDKAEEKLRRNIEAALKQTDGNKARAAQLLGIDRSTLWRRMQKYN